MSWLQCPTNPQGKAVIWSGMTKNSRSTQSENWGLWRNSLCVVCGSCVLHLHIDNKTFPTIFEVTNMTGPSILGMMQAKSMGCVKFPQIEWTHAFKMCTTTLRKIFTDRTHHPTTLSNSKKCTHMLKLYAQDYTWT